MAIGIGVGTGLRRAQPSISPALSSNSTSHSNSSTNIPHGAMNDTSFAAVTTSDGSRHIFFQDINGTLRHGAFSLANNLWLSDMDFLLPSPQVSLPQNNTPITALYTPDPNNEDVTIYVFYVNVNHSLSAVGYSPGQGIYSDYLNGSMYIPQDSRCLSVSPLPPLASDLSSSPLNALLFYESTSGGITLMHGQSFLNQTWHNEGWRWQNISQILPYPRYQSENSGYWLGYPCTSAPQYLNNNTVVEAVFYNPQSLIDLSASPAVGLYFDDVANISAYEGSSSYV